VATSGSVDYSLTAREVIQYALRKTNLLALGETADSDMVDAALVELNVLCKEWMKYPQIWRLKEGYVALVSDTASYSLTPRPYKVFSVRYRNASSMDLPMREMTKDEYYDLPDKTSNGIPTQWYFDPQRDTSSVYTWPVLETATTETLRVSYQRRYEDVDALTNEVDISQEHLSTVGHNLAARLADNFGRSGPHIDRVIQRAGHLFESMLDLDRPEVIRFVPESRYG
jgi:hypothetical protein